jgi:hypothetical protein
MDIKLRFILNCRSGTQLEYVYEAERAKIWFVSPPQAHGDQSHNDAPPKTMLPPPAEGLPVSLS